MTQERKKKIKTIVLLTLITVFCIWMYWGNTSIQTTYHRIHSERIPEEFEGFKIVQISDLHNSNYGKGQKRLLKVVKGASPDIIAVTGDLIDSNRTNVDKAMEFINGAVQIAPVYYVTGNHEKWTDEYGTLKTRMIEAGVIILEDEGTIIERGDSSIQLLGLNDPDFITFTDNPYRGAYLDAALKAISGDKSMYTILLSHRPEWFGIYAENGMDLVLSGHAHGGQVRLPFIGGVIAPNQGLFPKYTTGIYEKEQTRMVVSRGLGNSIVPIRVNNRREVVVITLAR